jgi:hypothetical protein
MPKRHHLSNVNHPNWGKGVTKEEAYESFTLIQNKICIFAIWWNGFATQRIRVIFNLSKMQNERMVKIMWPKKITFSFQKGTWGMASKTPYVMDIKQWRKFLERP